MNANSPLGPDSVPFTNDDGFRLTSASPARDAGTDVGLTTDILGNPIVGKPDIGPYEYQPSQMAVRNGGSTPGHSLPIQENVLTQRELSGILADKETKLFDSNGKKTSLVKPGVYFVQYRYGTMIQTRELIIQK